MEKKTPHTRLNVVKELVEQDKIRMTMSATDGADELGLDFDNVKQVVLALTSADFYKSMTTYSNHTVWQDVYRPVLTDCQVYLKLTVSDDFKER